MLNTAPNSQKLLIDNSKATAIDSSVLMPNTIVFHLDEGKTEVLKITPEGFFVRGVKVEQGGGEAQAVYDAFCEWLQASTRNL